MAYSHHRNTGRYRVFAPDIFAYGYQYGESWADNRRMERAFHGADHNYGRPGGAWPPPMGVYERRHYNPTGSYRSDKGHDEGGMEVVRVGDRFSNNSGSHSQQYPLPMVTAAARSPSQDGSDIYSYRNTSRTFVGSGSSWKGYSDSHMGKGSRVHRAQMPPPSVYPPSSCGTWRSESPYGEDHRDRNASRPQFYPKEDVLHGSGSANMYHHSLRPSGRWQHGEDGSYGSVSTTGYSRSGTMLFSDCDSEDRVSDSASIHSGREYVESSYLGSEYEEETEIYLSDGESYDSNFLEGTYDDVSSEGIYSGSEAGSDWISDDE